MIRKFRTAHHTELGDSRVDRFANPSRYRTSEDYKRWFTKSSGNTGYYSPEPEGYVRFHRVKSFLVHAVSLTHDNPRDNKIAVGAVCDLLEITSSRLHVYKESSYVWPSIMSLLARVRELHAKGILQVWEATMIRDYVEKHLFDPREFGVNIDVTIPQSVAILPRSEIDRLVDR